jgi:hypothetical protein
LHIPGTLESRETDDVGETDWKSHTFILRKNRETS